MAAGLIERLKGLLGGGGHPAPAGGEAALCVCALEGTNPDVARRLRQGEELSLRERGGEAVALRGSSEAGRIPHAERERVLGLLRRQADLGCRVVLADKGAGLVRVRISIRM